MPKCDWVFTLDNGYDYCERESAFELNGIHYCGEHEPYPPGEYPAEQTDREADEALRMAKVWGDA